MSAPQFSLQEQLGALQALVAGAEHQVAQLKKRPKGKEWPEMDLKAREDRLPILRTAVATFERGVKAKQQQEAARS